MEIYKKFTNFLNRYFSLFLLIVVLISYGLQLEMYVWKDDNAIFFKFNHLNEAAGYLGRGLLGEGTYKFSVTPYWFIYKLVGYDSIWPYYLLTLIFYYLSTLSVYKLFSFILSDKVGKIAGFLFACGYIAAEGFLWLAASMIINVSIILSCLTLFNLIRFLKTNNKSSYLLSLCLYFLSAYLTPVRTHYIFLIILACFIIFSDYKYNFRKWILSFISLTPFAVIFYKYFILDADTRTFSGLDFIKGLLSGKLYYLYSFFTTAGNLVVPDRDFELITQIVKQLSNHYAYYFVALLFVSLCLVILSQFIHNSKKRLFLGVFLFTSLIGIVISKYIVSSPHLPQYPGSFLLFYVGFLFLQLIFMIIIFSSEKRKEYLLLFCWFVISIFVYTSYLPDIAYSTTDRYLSHAFIPLVGILSFLSQIKIQKRSILFYILIGWGIFNINNSIRNELHIINTISNPSRSFYSQLKTELPEIKKGDIVYFDISPADAAYYSGAFSVGQMPDSTAIAWRYGLDRYDFQLITDYKNLKEVISKDPIQAKQIHSFFYINKNLQNTSSLIQNNLVNTNQAISIKSEILKETKIINKDNKYFGKFEDMILTPKEEVHSVTPIKVTFYIRANKLIHMQYPFFQEGTTAMYDDSFISLALDYQRYKNEIVKNSIYFSSSEWQDRKIINVHDFDVDSVWQPDRILWPKGQEFLIIDLGKLEDINRLAWINGFGNNTPTKFKIEVSTDNINWQEAKTVVNIQKIDTKAPQVVEFDSLKVRFVKIDLLESLSGDSPGIAEVWVIPTKLKEVDIRKSEMYLQSPFAYIPNDKAFNYLFDALTGKGNITVSWLNNKNSTWQTNNKSTLPLIYDGRSHAYELVIPAGGTILKQLKISNPQIPGTILIENVEITNLPLYEGHDE